MTDQVHKLGEVLRAAREGKGVDLPRVERDTKIRERYLSALERGEYRELPGAVYTKGFLRNYGAYLGLDPEYLIDLYRIETSTGSERAVPPTGPRPLAARRTRAFVVTPGAVVAAILTILVGGFFAYLGYELITFARMPELRITDPPGNVSGHRELTITLRGVTEPHATVSASELRENPTVRADANGNFEMTVQLLPGSNVVRLTASDPQTQRVSPVEERTIIVATEPDDGPSAPAVALALVEPAADAVLAGTVPLSGTAAPGAAVVVSAVPTAPAPVPATVTDPAEQPVAISAGLPSAPEALTLSTDATGAFTGSLTLAPAAWELTVATDGSDPIVRSVRVTPPAGLSVTVTLAGGDSYLELTTDGAAAEESGSIVTDGTQLTLTASDEVRVRAGNAGAVRVAVNGIDLGSLGAPGAVVEWRIRPGGG